VITLENIKATSCNTGVAVKDSSIATITGVTLRDNRYGILRYIKKPAYSYPEIYLTGVEYSGNWVDRRDEPADEWTSRYDN
jgi:hypothetical protein